MNAWWIVGIGYTVGLVFLGWAVWYARTHSPSRQAVKVEQQRRDAVRRAATAPLPEDSYIIGVRDGIVSGSEIRCPVCGGLFSEVGPTHRFKIEDDLRTCWTR